MNAPSRLLPFLREPHRARVACGLLIAIGVVLAVLTRPWFGDDFEQIEDKNFIHFYEAARALLEQRDPYQAAGGGYIYPPFLAVALMPLAALDWVLAGRIWACLVAASLLGVILLSAHDSRRRLGAVPDAFGFSVVAFAAVLLSARAIKHQIGEGQSDYLVAGAFILALVCLDRCPTLAGLVLGLAANVKYHTLVVLPYLLVRRRYRAAASTLASTILFALAPALVIGWDRTFASWRTALGGLGGLSGRPDNQAGVPTHEDAPAFSNLYDVFWEHSLSLTSVLARFLREAGLADRDGSGTGLVFIGTALLAALLFALGWGLYRAHGVPFPLTRAPDDQQTRDLVGIEWWGLVVGILALSPQTHHRHLLLMLGMGAFAVAFLLTGGVRGRTALLASIACFALSLLKFESWSEPLADDWRFVGGPILALLVLYFVLLSAVLRRRSADAQRHT